MGPRSLKDYLSSNFMANTLGIDPHEVISEAFEIIAILIGTFLLARGVDAAFKIYIRKAKESGRMNQAVDLTIYTLFHKILVISIYVAGTLMAAFTIPYLQSVTLAMLTGAGLVGVALGLAAQSSLSNIISGIFLAIFKPIRVGDYVEFEGDSGYVEDLTLRHTVICTWDRRRVIVPNSTMNTTAITNYTIKEPYYIYPIDFNISHDMDIDRARNIMIDEAGKNPHIVKEKSMRVMITELKDHSATLRLTFYAMPAEAFNAACDIREAIKRRLDAEGIDMKRQDQDDVALAHPVNG